MCDTFVVPPSATKLGKMIFARNSDREPNEAQALIRFSGEDFPTGTKVKCTYIEIPQARQTFDVVLSKPVWMWGAEMGVNAKGVAIGNEAVFTKVKINKNNSGLTGMDLVRIGLERANRADHALEIIIELLEEFGQDACGGFEDKNFFYHNSFLIADTNEAWVLETAGKNWVAEKVKGPRSISNGLTIGSEYDLISKNAISFAHKKGWVKSQNDFRFANAYSSGFMTWASACQFRQHQTTEGVSKNGFEIADAIKVLTYHNPDFSPNKASTQNVCMHATGLTCPNQTTASMIAELGESVNIWVTGTSNPCLSLFKPISFFDEELNSLSNPGLTPDDSLWWQAERLHRRANENYSTVKNFLKENLQTLQDQCLIENASTRSSFYFQEHKKIIEKGLREFELNSPRKSFSPIYNWYWKNQNRKIKI